METSDMWQILPVWNKEASSKMSYAASCSLYAWVQYIHHRRSLTMSTFIPSPDDDDDIMWGAREKSLLFLDGDWVTPETPIWETPGTPILLSSSSLANSSAPVSSSFSSSSSSSLLLVESVVVLLVAGDGDVQAALERKGSPPWLLSFDQKKMKTWPISKSDDDRFIEEVELYVTICKCICIPILAKASHFEYEQASLEIFREIL